MERPLGIILKYSKKWSEWDFQVLLLALITSWFWTWIVTTLQTDGASFLINSDDVQHLFIFKSNLKQLSFLSPFVQNIDQLLFYLLYFSSFRKQSKTFLMVNIVIIVIFI